MKIKKKEREREEEVKEILRLRESEINRERKSLRDMKRQRRRERRI